jgi:hypothetical protein
MRQKSTPAVAWLAELVRRSSILDAVEDLHGPALLCWTTYFFIKEAGDPAFVSWHRDSTYWGLSTPDVVTAWVAFTQATEANGAMEYIPRGHKLDQIPNCDTLYRVVWHPPRGASQGSPLSHESFPLWVTGGGSHNARKLQHCLSKQTPERERVCRRLSIGETDGRHCF